MPLHGVSRLRALRSMPFSDATKLLYSCMRHGILFTDKCTQKTENAVFTVFCHVLPPCNPATAALKWRIRQCGRLTFGEHHVSIRNRTLSMKKRQRRRPAMLPSGTATRRRQASPRKRQQTAMRKLSFRAPICHILQRKRTAFAKRANSRGKTAEISAPACGINLRRRAHCHRDAA